MPSRIEHDNASPAWRWPKNILTKKLDASQFTPQMPPILKRKHVSQYPIASSANRGSGEPEVDLTLKRGIWEDRLVMAQETWHGLIPIPSPPPSPTDAESCNLCADTDYDGTQSPRRGRRHEPTSLSKKTKDSAVRKASGGMRSSRSQCRRNFHLSVAGGGGGRDDDDDGYGSDSGRDSGAGSDARLPKQLLACPFYKHDSMRYMSCVRLRLTRVRDVKQHLNRRHRRPMHCPMCGDIFADSQHWDAHILARTCVRPPDGFNIEGVTETQSIALARRVNRSLDEASQWFSIWEILFPDSPRPSSPYLSNHFEETLGMVYDYWRRHGQALVAELDEPASSGDDRSSRVSVLSSQVVETLLFRFRTSSQAAMDLTSSNPTTAEFASCVSAGSVPEPTALPSCPPELSPPPAPPRLLQQQRRHSPQGDSGMRMSRSNTYTSTDTADSHASVALSQSQCTPGLAATGETTSSQMLSPYSTDTVHASPYSQLDGPIAMGADGFPAPTQVHLPGSTGTVALTDHLGSLEPALTFMGMWLNPDISVSNGALAPVEQGLGISLAPLTGDPDTSAYLTSDNYSDPNLYQYPELLPSGDG